MAMIPKNPKGPAPAAAPAASTAAAPAAAAAHAPAAQANEPGPAAGAAAEQTSTSTAVAAAATNAVSTRVNSKPVDVLTRDFKDAVKVEWNTLHRIMVNQGMYLDKENGNKPIGKEITLEMISYQDGWQISPGTNEPAAAELVRYSEDGVMTNQGENCAEYLAALKTADYAEAKMTKRVTIAGILQACDDATLIGKMVQIDLSQTSRNLFDRHRMQVALDIGQGRRKEDDPNLHIFKMGTQVQTKGQNTWTMATFGYST